MRWRGPAGTRCSKSRAGPFIDALHGCLDHAGHCRHGGRDSLAVLSLMPDFPARGVAIAQALYAQNPGLTTGSAEQQQLFVQLVAEQMAFEISTDYGLKRAAINRPQGPSQIAYDRGPFGGWRIIDNDGSVTGVLGGIIPQPVWQPFEGQVFISVKPTDHLKVSGPTPDPPLPPPPAPPVDLSPILARIAQLEATVNALASQLPVVASEANEALHRPYPRYVAKLWGAITIVSVPEGS
jgi:hypothetical protein